MPYDVCFDVSFCDYILGGGTGMLLGGCGDHKGYKSANNQQSLAGLCDSDGMFGQLQ
jgi:hypothetical protein